MRLLLVTDLHGRRDVLEQILANSGPVDAALLGGDITDFGAPADAEKIVEQVQAAAPAVLAVAGNCDSAAIDRRLLDLGVGLHGRGLVHAGVRFQGLSAMPPWIHTMYQFTEEQLAEALQAGWAAIAGRAGPHVVLAHAPPRGALDRTWLLHHVGSTALREFIEAKQPALVVCGHIHEGRGIETLNCRESVPDSGPPEGTTTVVNCGKAAAGQYAIAEVGDAVRVELREA